MNIKGTQTGRFYAGTKDTCILYGSHLQIVADRERHEQLKKAQLITYPSSIIVTPAVLQLHHKQAYINYMDTIRHVSINAVWYLLPAGTYGAPDGYHCNGVRYGIELSDYVSFVNIKSITGE